MPVRPRRQRRHRTALTAPRMLALTLGPLPWWDEPDDVLAGVYAEHRERLSPSPRWWGWWRFEAHVPTELRGARPPLYRPEDAERVRSERADLEDRRAAWLAGASSTENGASGATKQT